MIDWLSAKWWRMPAILIVYFSLHVAARSLVSPSLDYDESEQVFLSQCFSCGYNSQPPLYTWVQTGLFEILGYSVFSLAVLKNLLLCGTYLLVFGLVRTATGNLSLGAIAALGLLTIPQISWESHRDLSHTVAVTFATMLTFYSVVSLAKDGRSRWYVLIGIATGLGILSKYNFAIVIVGMIVAGLTVPTYRKQLLDWRMALAVAIATVMILPHAIWVAAHLELTSSKTMATLTTNQSNDWFQNVSAGFAALAVSTLACCAITLATFLPCVYCYLKARSVKERNPPDDQGWAATLLLERFLISIAIVLCVLVLSGHALEFKNRWLQPFVVLVPAYFVLRMRSFFPSERQLMNRVCAISFVLIFLILTAVVTRPLIGRYRNQYCWLNVPYNELASTIYDQVGNAPAIIVAPNMRIAGNMRLHFPDTPVISEDQRYLAERIVAEAGVKLQASKVVVVTDETKIHEHNRLMTFVNQVLQVSAGSRGDWRRVDLDYLYGTGDAHQEFFLRKMAVERVALQPSSPEDKTR